MLETYAPFAKEFAIQWEAEWNASLPTNWRELDTDGIFQLWEFTAETALPLVWLPRPPSSGRS